MCVCAGPCGASLGRRCHAAALCLVAVEHGGNGRYVADSEQECLGESCFRLDISVYFAD